MDGIVYGLSTHTSYLMLMHDGILYFFFKKK